VLAHPASGRDDGEHAFDYAVAATGPGDPVELGLPLTARSVLSGFTGWGGHGCSSPVGLDRDDVLVTAVKRADRGPGLVLRLTRFGDAGQVLLSSPGPLISQAWLCDARERDLAPLASTESEVLVPLGSTITSIRLIFKDYSAPPACLESD